MHIFLYNLCRHVSTGCRITMQPFLTLTIPVLLRERIIPILTINTKKTRKRFYTTKNSKNSRSFLFTESIIRMLKVFTVRIYFCKTFFFTSRVTALEKATQQVYQNYTFSLIVELQKANLHGLWYLNYGSVTITIINYIYHNLEIMRERFEFTYFAS